MFSNIYDFVGRMFDPKYQTLSKIWVISDMKMRTDREKKVHLNFPRILCFMQLVQGLCNNTNFERTSYL